MTKLLVVVVYDVNNKFYLLCLVIVEEETNGNWSCFLDLLIQYVIGGCTGLCIIS